MDYKNNSNTGLIIVADCMLLSVEYIGNVHLFFNRNSWVGGLFTLLRFAAGRSNDVRFNDLSHVFGRLAQQSPKSRRSSRISIPSRC